MNRAAALLIIVKRTSEAEFAGILQKHGVPAVISIPGQGTAGRNILSLLGIESTEKMVLVSVASRKSVKQLMSHMVSDMGINLPGHGIALSIPLTSIGGAASVGYFMGKIDDKNEVNEVEEKLTFPYDLIMAISKRGCSEQVMAAARTAGAGGGTIVHAKGTAAGAAEKFFGISIADEKELILIATRHEKKDAIMHAIMEKAGARADAHTVLFSLPVEDVVGLRSIMTDNQNENP